jgi:hypothetical protein
LPVSDEATGEFEERLVDVGLPFPAHPETSEAVQPGERALYRPAVDTQSAAVGCAAAGDDGQDSAGTNLVAVDAVVVAAVGKE